MVSWILPASLVGMTFAVGGRAPRRLRRPQSAPPDGERSDGAEGETKGPLTRTRAGRIDGSTHPCAPGGGIPGEEAEQKGKAKGGRHSGHGADRTAWLIRWCCVALRTAWAFRSTVPRGWGVPSSPGLKPAWLLPIMTA